LPGPFSCGILFREFPSLKGYPLSETVWIVALGAIVAGFVQGLSGFAFGLVAMSFWAWTVEPQLAAALVVWCPIMLFSRSLPPVRFGGRLADGVVGLVGGIMAGLGGFSGPVPALWCTLRQMEKDAQRTVIQNFNLATLAVTMATYLATGAVKPEMLPLFAVVAPAMLLPTLLGSRLYIGISEKAFRRIVLGLLTVSGAAMLAATLPQLLA